MYSYAPSDIGFNLILVIKFSITEQYFDFLLVKIYLDNKLITFNLF